MMDRPEEAQSTQQDILQHVIVYSKVNVAIHSEQPARKLTCDPSLVCYMGYLITYAQLHLTHHILKHYN